MKTTLRGKIIAVFLCVFLLVLGGSLLFNSVLLPRFYEKSRARSLTSLHAELEELLSTESGILELKQSCQADNISLFILTPTGEIAFSTTTDLGVLKDQLLNHIFNDRPQNMQILEEDESYQLIRANDPHMETAYLELWGVLDNCSFIMRTPLESITKSAHTANIFLAYCCIGGLILGILLILILSKRVMEPVKQLTVLSDRMANLDFDARYEGETYDEIGVLGENYNRMSQSLQTVIADLKSANLKLQKDLENRERQEEMRSEFISNVSHELKTPIALIKGYAEGLESGLANDETTRQEYSHIITDEADKMNRLVKNLLQLNELEFGRSTPEVERFEIRELAENVLIPEKLPAKEAGVTLVNDIPKGVCVWGDSFMIAQVISNFLSNAIHYAKGEKKVTLSAESADGHLRVKCFNTGEQIPEEKLDRIWEKFYKVDKARTRAYGGNGIGLSIVKAIMDAHQNAYGVVNEKDGVTFWFELNED